jgi:predicted nucleic acid-binding protein
MTTGDKRCVVDTNFLVYSTVSSNPWHHEARGWLTALKLQEMVLCATTQILREYLVVLTRGDVFKTTFTADEALSELEALLPSLEVLGETEESAARLRDLVRRYQVRGKQIHDANIVAVMLSHGVSRLATYNRTDFERFKEVTLEPIQTTVKENNEPKGIS